jgi:tryptophan-rich sensory protein
VIGVRLCVDAGLLVIVLVSMAVGRPFTLQYAREQVAPEFWHRPDFIRTNYVITAVWALAFAVMVIAELALLYVPDLPPRAGVIVIVLALVGAVKFTGWYPERVRGQTTAA